MNLPSQFGIGAKRWLDQAGDQLNEGVQLLPLRFLSRLVSQQAGLNPPVQITSLKDLDDSFHQMLEKILGFHLVVEPGNHGFGSSQGKAPSGMVKLVARGVWLAYTADRGSGICCFGFQAILCNSILRALRSRSEYPISAAARPQADRGNSFLVSLALRSTGLCAAICITRYATI